MVLLVAAVALIRWVALSRWGWTIGSVRASPTNGTTFPSDRRASILAACIERAALRLPFATKCLARAVALQWRLRLSGIPSDLVIAFHAIDRTSEDGFHAWVEHDGDMVIGHCDREMYHPVMTLSHGHST